MRVDEFGGGDNVSLVLPPSFGVVGGDDRGTLRCHVTDPAHARVLFAGGTASRSGASTTLRVDLRSAQGNILLQVQGLDDANRLLVEREQSTFRVTCRASVMYAQPFL